MKEPKGTWNNRNKNLFYIIVLTGIVLISAVLSFFLEKAADNQIQKKAEQIAADAKEQGKEPEPADLDKGADMDNAADANNGTDAENGAISDNGTDVNYPLAPGSSTSPGSPTAPDNPAASAETGNKKEETGGESQENAISEQAKKDFDKELNAYRNEFVTEIKGTKEKIAAFLNGQEDAFKSAIADYVFSTFGTITVDAVHIKELVSDSERDLTYRITIEIEEEEVPFICSYHKSMKFFSLYSPSELQ